MYKCNHRPTGRCHHWLYGRPISVQLYEPDLLVAKVDEEYSILKNRTEPDHIKLLEKLDNIEDEFDLELDPMETII